MGGSKVSGSVSAEAEDEEGMVMEDDDDADG